MNLSEDFLDLLDECTALIDRSGLVEPRQRLPLAEPLPSLLEQTQRITEQVGEDVESVRIVTHFACTGGTLIAKCLASMPNTSVLSEVAPHSTLVDGTGRFFPTDLIQLCRLGKYPVTEQLVSELFHGGLRVLREHARRSGQYLVLRDHAHSKYCVGEAVAATPTLVDEVGTVTPVRAVVTVRHPLDSFLSLMVNEWSQFRPFDIDEYCRRYLAFLDDHEGLSIHKYEDFTGDPLTTARALCEALALPFNEQFADVFAIHRFSGDSGRRSNTIGVRSRRAVPAAVQDALNASESYASLCARLRYAPEVSGG